jgi:hypothetical protein
MGGFELGGAERRGPFHDRELMRTESGRAASRAREI